MSFRIIIAAAENGYVLDLISNEGHLARQWVFVSWNNLVRWLDDRGGLSDSIPKGAVLTVDEFSKWLTDNPTKL